MIKRIIIFGAGAVGSVIGGVLAKNGYNTVLIGRRQHIEKINKNGLKLIRTGSEWVQTIKAVTTLQEAQPKPEDVIFLSVKSKTTDNFINIAEKNELNKSIPVFSLQNGMFNEEKLGKYFNSVYTGIVRMTCSMLDYGEVIYKKEGRLILGKYPSGYDELVNYIGKIFTSSGFNVTVSKSVMSDRWLKLLVNLINLNVSIVKREDQDKKEFYYLAAKTLEEGIDTLKKANIDFSPSSEKDPSAEEMLTRLKNGKPYYRINNFLIYISTWQDLYYKRKPLECEEFYKTIIDIADKVDSEVPYNRKLLKFAKIASEKSFKPESFSLKEFKEYLKKL